MAALIAFPHLAHALAKPRLRVLEFSQLAQFEQLPHGFVIGVGLTALNQCFYFLPGLRLPFGEFLEFFDAGAFRPPPFGAAPLVV